MCKELEDELKRGDEAGNALAAHLIAMGAANLRQTVEVDGVRVHYSIWREDCQPVEKSKDKDAAIPSQSANPKGLHQRYAISRADGTPTDPNAVYFVGRLDNGGKDPVHLEACRQAARMYVTSIGQLSGSEHLHQMAKELDQLIDRLASERVDFPGFLSCELRDMLKNAEALQFAIDYHDNQASMADGMGYDDCVKFHDKRREILATRKAELESQI